MTICNISLLVSNGINCLNLFLPIWILVSTAASTSPSNSACQLNNKTYPLTPDFHWHLYVHLCILYRLLDSCNFYKQMSLCTCYTTTFPVYSLLTTSTLYWIITKRLYHRHHTAILQPSVCSEVQVICIWSSWCSATPSSLASFKPRMIYLFGAGLPSLSWKRDH